MSLRGANSLLGTARALPENAFQRSGRTLAPMRRLIGLVLIGICVSGCSSGDSEKLIGGHRFKRVKLENGQVVLRLDTGDDLIRLKDGRLGRAYNCAVIDSFGIGTGPDHSCRLFDENGKGTDQYIEPRTLEFIENPYPGMP